MKNKEFLVVLIFFTGLTLVFFYKIFFGLISLPADLIVGGYYPWLDYKWGYPAGVPVKNPIISDAVSIVYPLRFLAVDLIKKGELPLWNWQMFGGYPLLASMPAALFFPTMAFYLIFSKPLAWTLQIMVQPLLGLIFMYILTRHLGLKVLPAIFSSIAFAFGGFSMIWLEWNTHVATAVFLPLLIFLEDKLISENKWRWGIGLSFILALQIFAGYAPAVIFSFLALVLWYLVKSRSVNVGLKLVFFACFGAMLSAVFLLPSSELLSLSQRQSENLGLSNAFLPWQYWVGFFSPDFFGNHATGNFWGEGSYVHMAIYSGIITLILAVIGAVVDFSRKEVKFSVILAILALLIMFPNPIGALFYQLGLWGGSSMSMDRAAFLVNFALALLAGFGLASLGESRWWLNAKIAVGLLGVLLGLGAGLIISLIWLQNSLSPTGADLVHLKVALRNLIFPISLVVIVAGLLLWTKSKGINQFIRLGLVLLLIVELFRFGWKFNSFSPIGFLYPPTPVTEFLQKFPNERILAEKEILSANMWLPYGLESIAGYDAIYPLNIAKLIGIINSGNINTSPQTKNGVVDRLESPAIGRVGTKFILALKRNQKGEIDQKGEVNKRLEIEEYQPVMEDKSVVVLQNRNSLPRAYLVNRVVKASDKETLEAFLKPDFSFKNTALTGDLDFYSESDLVQETDYRRFTNDHIQVIVKSSTNTFLVVLDTFYPGWQARIDSEPVKIYRTNYAFRGVLVPKGEHLVDFFYKPNSLTYGATVSLLAILVLLGSFVYSWIRQR